MTELWFLTAKKTEKLLLRNFGIFPRNYSAEPTIPWSSTRIPEDFSEYSLSRDLLRGTSCWRIWQVDQCRMGAFDFSQCSQHSVNIPRFGSSLGVIFSF